MIPEHENYYVEYLIHVGEELTGISLEQLGYKPRPEDLSADERNDLETWDLDWLESVTPEQRDKSLFQAKLLAGALSEASAVLIDQLFEDFAELRSLAQITRQDIAGSFVLSRLPPGHAEKYDVRFAQRFLVIATDMAGALVRGWTHPSWWPRNWRSGACWTRWKSSRTCTGLIWPAAGAAGWKNACSKTRTAKCFTRTRWTDSKPTSNSTCSSASPPWSSRTGSSPSTTLTFLPSALITEARRPYFSLLPEHR
jgi:hypothetical protein